MSLGLAGRPHNGIPTTVAALRTYVVNLPRRRDRRGRMQRILPPQLQVTFTSDFDGCFDGHELSRTCIEQAGYRPFAWQIDSDNPWWNRPLKLGEIGCTLAHLACWRDAARAGAEPFVLILEDDAILAPRFLDRLLSGLTQLASAGHSFDLLYLGRYPLEPDRPAAPGFVTPGYSHCTFGYLLAHDAVTTLLGLRLDQAIVPVDEFLPSLYTDHPRQDLRARFPRQLTALAFDPPIVRQLPKDEAGSDTEDSDFLDA